jgi:hypothetical protein
MLSGVEMVNLFHVERILSIGAYKTRSRPIMAALLRTPQLPTWTGPHFPFGSGKLKLSRLARTLFLPECVDLTVAIRSMLRASRPTHATLYLTLKTNFVHSGERVRTDPRDDHMQQDDYCLAIGSMS